MTEPAQVLPAVPQAPPQVTPNAVKSHQSFLDVLLNQKKLTQEQIAQLQNEQLQTNQSFENLILEKKLVSEMDLVKAKSEYNKIPFIRMADTSTSPEALKLVGESVARRYQVLPFALDKSENSLKVAMVDPLNLSTLAFLKQKTGMRIETHYAVESELTQAVNDRYSQDISSDVSQALEQTQGVAKEGAVKEAVTSGGVVRDAPINRIVETILDFAIKSRSSDVHIEPQIGRTRVRYRIDGILTEKLVLPRTVHDAVVSRIKIVSNLKIDERRIPQDGRFNYVNDAKEIDLRVSTLPTINGEKVVMRLLEKNTSVPTLEDLGLTNLSLKRVRDAIKVPRGIVLVTGPTGSGKTTTLYSVLNKINTPKVNIMTIEDPVEYQITGVSQVQVNVQAGLTFASGLRSFLRQDPDIIMVGEVRDTETAELAVQASLTGHLVFSTLHTSSAAGAFPRLLDMGAEPFLLASTMTIVIGQRVVRKINEEYREEYTPEPAVVADVKRVLGPIYDQWCKTKNKDPNKMILYRPSQNRPATEPEYMGRVGIFEVMPVTENINRMIVERKSDTEMERESLRNGMLLMKQDGYIKSLEGITTVEEVLRVAEV